jgi:hypothetical protein
MTAPQDQDPTGPDSTDPGPTDPGPTDPGRVRPTRRRLPEPLHWLFHAPAHDRYVLGQFPNLLLAVFLVARGAEWLLPLAGTARDVVHVVGTLALAGWALDELVRGVNPFRRLLGLGILTVLAVDVLA